MAVVGLVVHHERAEAADLARSTRSLAGARATRSGCPRRTPTLVGLPDLASTATFGAGLDLVVSLGGDGTMLRTVDLVAPTACPSSASTSASSATSPRSSRPRLHDALERFFAGDYDIEERMLLAVTRRRRPAGATAGRIAGAQRGGGREDADAATPCASASTIDGDALHHLRRRRPDRGHADRFDGLRLVGPGPDRRARPTGPCC